MSSRLFDLVTIATGPEEPVGGNRLRVTPQSVATVKKGLLGSAARAVRERSTITAVHEGRAEEVVDMAGLGVEAQRARRGQASGRSLPRHRLRCRRLRRRVLGAPGR